MGKHLFDKILGHNINYNVKRLLEKVTSLFPHKRLLIHPLSCAEKELGERHVNVNGLSKPSLTNYIGIWINENLPTNEFNIILAEELYHHIQAYNKYPTILDLHDNVNIELFGNRLNNNILDMNAHYHLNERNFDITPLQNRDYLDAIDSIKTFTQEQLSKYRKYDLFAVLFPQYLLWWYDLIYLSSDIIEKWETEINRWFSSIIPPQTEKLWASLLRFIEKNPPHSPQSAETSMTEICRKLFNRTPSFEDMDTTGLHIYLILKELVPI